MDKINGRITIIVSTVALSVGLVALAKADALAMFLGGGALIGLAYGIIAKTKDRPPEDK